MALVAKHKLFNHLLASENKLKINSVNASAHKALWFHTVQVANMTNQCKLTIVLVNRPMITTLEPALAQEARR
jgi:hypothetical protein